MTETTATNTTNATLVGMVSPCNCLSGRLYDICNGTAIGVSRKLRNEYLDLWLLNGTLTADPRIRQPESRQPREKQERTEGAKRSNGRSANPCRHLGEVLRSEVCKVCGGTRQYDVHACTIHGECAIRELKSKLRKCINCVEYEAQ